MRKACEGIPERLIKAGVFSRELYEKVLKGLAEYRAKKAGGAG